MAREQIRMLSEKLLSFHMSPKKEKKDIARISQTLAKYLYSHDYIISRREARDELKLKIVLPQDVNGDFEKTIYHLYKLYEADLELNTPYSPEVFLGETDKKIGTFRRAYIESLIRTDVFITRKYVERVTQTRPEIPIPIVGFMERVFKEGWELET